MKQMWFHVSWIGIISLLCLSAIALSNDPQWRWRFRVQPPIPAEATSLKMSHPSNEVEQIIQFDIDPGVADRVQQLYRTGLPNYGWRYRCTVDKPLNVDMELMDVYERSTTQNPKGETLEVGIGKQFGGKRVIQLNEWLTRLPPYKHCSGYANEFKFLLQARA